MKFSCICVHIVTYYIYIFCCENGGGGGVMDLVYGSFSSSWMDCEVIFIYECYRFAYMGFV